MKDNTFKRLLIGVLLIGFGLFSVAYYNYSVKEAAVAHFNRQTDYRIDAISAYAKLKHERIEEDIETIARQKNVKEVSGHLTQYTRTTAKTEMTPQLGTEAERNLYDYFESYAMSHDDLKYIYMADASGGYVSWPASALPAGYDPRERPWYQVALEGGGHIHQTTPYVDQVTDLFILSNVKALYDEQNSLLGVVGIDYSYETTIDDLDFFEMKPYERLVIFHETGVVLSDSKNRLETIALSETYERDDKGNFFFKIDGIRHLARLEPLEDNGVLMMSLFDYDALIADYGRGVQWDIVVSLVVLGGIFLALIVLVYYVYYSRVLKKRISEKEKRQLALENNIPGIVFRSKAKWPWLMYYMSEGVYETTGYPASDFLIDTGERQWRDIVLEDDIHIVDAPIDLEAGSAYNLVYRIRTRSGDVIWVSEVGRLVKDSKGMLYIDGVILDISEEVAREEMLKKTQTELESTVTALKEKNQILEETNLENQALYEEMAAAEETLRYNYDELEAYRIKLEEEKLRYQLILKASKEAFWEYSPQTGGFEIANAFKWADSELDALEAFLERVHPEDRLSLIWFDEAVPDYTVIPEVYEVDAKVAVKDHQYRWHHFIGVVVRDVFGNVSRIVGSLSDVHETTIQKERIMFYAFHDSATGLYNLDYLLDKVGNDLMTQGSENALLLVAGARHYGKLVESYGRNKTDILLFQLGAGLKTIFEDIEEISTLPRGRFAIWLGDKYDKSRAEACIAAIEAQVASYMYSDLLYSEFGFIYSGVALESEVNEAQKALKYAEIAFDYAEKNLSSGNIAWFDRAMQEEKDREVLVERHLRKAVVNDELYLVLQPQYSSYDKSGLHGYEALVRWKNPELGFVSPGEFIPLAEENGLIYEIGRFVVRETIAIIKAYEAQFDEEICIAINASLKEIVRDEYVSYILEKVRENAVKPHQIHIEITETAISEYIDRVVNNLNKLSENGFEIHMDDFGTGYSSLSMLGRLPVNVLKIDQSFVAGIENDDKMHELTQLVIQMGHGFHMKIIAEGVETKVQYDILDAMGCDYYQGYGLSKPIEKIELLTPKG